VAARHAANHREPTKYFEYFGLNRSQADRFLDAVRHVLSDEPITREALASAVARHTQVRELESIIIGSRWGGPLKPSALRGDLCFGPNRGRNVTFVRPSAWLGRSVEQEPESALREICRRYLSCFGPVAPKQFARWWDISMQRATTLFDSLSEETKEVDIAGRRCVVLKRDLQHILDSETESTVRLLPLFDAYTFNLVREHSLIPAEHLGRVFRAQGWISAVVLVNGCVMGTWEHTNTHTHTAIAVSMFQKPESWIIDMLSVEAERLADFMGCRTSIRMEVLSC